MKDSLYTIQEASAFLKVSANTLRRWEEQGIIKPIRTAGNQRRYRYEDLQKISSRRRYKRVIITRSLETPAVVPAPQNISAPAPAKSQTLPIRPIVYSGTKPHHMSGIPFPEIYKNLPSNQPMPTERKKRDFSFKTTVGKPAFFQTLGALSMIVLLMGALVTWHSLSTSGVHAKKKFQAKVETQNVLAATTAKPAFELQVNIPGMFSKKVTFLDNAEIKKSLTVAGLSSLNGGVQTNGANIDAGKGKVTASNIIYSVLPGSGIIISGDKQNPTISANVPVSVSSFQGQTGAVTLANGSGIGITGTTISNTGVLSLQGTTGAVTLTNGSGITLNGLQIGNSGVLSFQGNTGDVTLTAGGGIGISGTTISNTDTGSAQNIFKTVTAGGTNIIASSNNDTINFAAGSGITLTGDANSKTVTITNNSSGTLAGLNTNGVLYATSSNTAGSTNPGTNGTVLHGVTGGPPVFSAVNLTADVTGVLPIGNGGTGVNGTPGNGEVLIGNGSGYTLGNIFQGAGIDITDAAGAITVTNTGVTSLSGTPNQVSVNGNTGIIQISLPQNIDTSATPTFAALTLTNNTNQLTLGSGTTGVITMATLTSGRTYTLPDTSGTFCLSTGNCVGTGGLIGGSGTNNFIAKFTGGGNSVGNSSIFDNGQVAIGTTSPQGLFSVFGGVAGQALVSLNNTNEQNILVGSASGTTRFAFDSNGNLNINGGAYQIGGTTILSTTTLAPSVVNSALTSVGTLNAGSISSGFGNIDVGVDSIAGGDITSVGTTGYTSTGNGAGLLFSGTGNHLISASGGVLQLGAATLTGTLSGGGQNITGLGTINGLGITANTGTITAGTWNGSTIGTTYGGTGVNGSAAANGTLLIGNGSGFALNTLTAGSGIVINNTLAGHITISQTGSGSSKWTVDSANGVLYPNNSTLDVLLGGTSTASANFAFTNDAGGIPTETISNGGGNSLSLTGDGNITANGQDLSFTTSGNMNFQDVNLSGPVQLSNGATGLDAGLTNGIIDAINIAYESATGTGVDATWTASNGTLFPTTVSRKVGIGVSSSAPITSSLYVTRDVSGSGALGKALSIFDQPEAQDIIAASASGVTKFVVANNGSLKFDGGSGFLNTLTSQAVANQTIVIPQLSGSDTICFHDLGNCVGAGSGVTASGGVNKQIAFFTGATTISSNSNLFYDYTKNLLGIGNNSPVGELDVKGAVPGKALVILNETGDQALFTASASGVTQFTIDHTGNLTAAGNETIQGTTGATYSGNAAGITFSGSGTHVISKSSGTLQFGALTFGGAINGNSQNITGLGTINGLAITPDTGTITAGTWNATAIGPTFGGTGQTSYATGDMLYANAANSLTKLSIGSSGQILTISGGVPVWTTAGGTVNFWQLNNGALSPFTISNDLLLGSTATGSAKFGFLNNAGGVPTATISAASGSNALYLTGDGTLGSTNRQSLNIGSGSTGNIVLGNGASGVSLNLGSDATGDLYYRNSSGTLSRLAIGGASQIITVSGGVPVWSNAAGTVNFWQEANGALTPLNITDDLLLGATATTSARFAFLNNAAGVPTASISAANGNNALYLTGNGTLATTNRQNLNIGSSSTGNIVIGNGASGLTLNLGSDTTGDLYYRNSSGTLSRLGIGGAGQILSVSSGLPTWTNAGGTVNFWQETNGALSPLNSTDDLLLGANATSSAKFAVLNIAGGTPVASVAGNFVVSPTIIGGNQVGGNIQLTQARSIQFTDISGNPQNILTYGRDLNNVSNNTVMLTNPAITGSVQIGVTNAGSQGVVQFFTGNQERMRINHNGFVNIGTTIPGNAMLTVNNPFATGDLFTASVGGTTKFTVRYDGSLVASNFTSNNGLLYTNGSGVFQQLGIGSNGTCLTVASGALSWAATCSGSGTTFWQEANGALAPINTSDDLLLGSTATASAKFGFLNNAAGVPTASISAATGNNGLYLTGNGTLATTNRQTLSLGSSSTGNIVLGNGASGITLNVGSDATGDLYFRNSSGTLSRLGIGSSNNCLLSNGTTPFWNTCPGGAGSNVWQENAGALSPSNITDDLLLGSTATNSALFAIKGVASGTPVASLTATTNNNGLVLDAANSTVQSLRNNTLQIGGATTGDIQFKPGNSGSSLYLASNGTVGIGTTTPFGLADIASGTDVFSSINTATNYNLLIRNTSQLNDTGQGIGFEDANTNVLGASIVLQRKDVSNDWLEFYTRQNTTAVESLALDSLGNVGVGKFRTNGTQMLATLDVRGNIATTPIASFSGATTFANTVIDQSGTGDIFTASKSGTTKFVIANSGNVYLANSNFLGFYDNTGAFQNALTMDSSNDLRLRNLSSGDVVLGMNNVNNTNSIKFATKDQQIRMQINANGLVGINTGAGSTNVNAILDVEGVGNNTLPSTIPIASFSGQTTFAGMVVDNTGLGDIFTASKSGATKFTILNNGNLKLNNYTTAGGVLYTSGTGLLTQTPQGTSGQILESTGAGGTPTWIDASTVGVNYWQSNNNALAPVNITNDLLLGGTATTSAKFGFLNNAGGTPTASISAQSGTNSALVLAGDGSIQSVKDQTLTIGGPTTGNITLSPLNGSGTALVNGTLNLTSGKTYQIAGTDVLSGTTLGSGVVNSSLTSVGVLNAGSITSGFGSIDVGSDAISGGNLTGSGTITFSNATFTGGNNQVLFSTNGTGVLNTATTNTSSLCLLSGASTPTWGTCTGINYWQLNTNALSPGNSTYDFLLGGTATTSAKFALTGNAGTATPVASIAATPSSGGSNGLSLSGTGTIQSLNGNTLTIGGSQTGNILINSPSILRLNTNNNSQIVTGTGLVTTGGNLEINGNNIQDSNAATRLTFSNNVLQLVNTSTLSDSNLATITSAAQLGISATTLNIGNGSNASLATTSNGNLTLTAAGSGQTLLSSDFDSGVAIGAANATAAPLVINGGIGNNGALIVNQLNNGDIIDASASGTTKFQVTNNGTVNLTNYGGSKNSVLFADSTANGVLTKVGATSTGNQCLLSASSGTPAWGSCDLGTTSWVQANGTIYPGNTTEDLLIGGTATASADFAFIGVAGGSTPTASIGGNLAIVAPTGQGPNDKINIYNGGSLNFQISPGGDAGLTTALSINKSGQIGIGTTNPGSADKLDVELGSNQIARFYDSSFDPSGIWGVNIGLLSQSATAELTTAGTDDMAFFTGGTRNSMTAGTERMRITNGGTVGIGTSAPDAQLSIQGADGNNPGLVVNQKNFGNIFVASSSGNLEFAVTNQGGIQTGSGIGSNGQCLVSGGAGGTAGYTNCTAGNFWTLKSGLLYAGNTTTDFAIGGNSTASANFAVLNNNAGTPTTAVNGDLTLTGGANMGTATLTGADQNDVCLFSSDCTTAQSGNFNNKLKIYGGSSNTRNLQLWQSATGGTGNGTAFIDANDSDLEIQTGAGNGNILLMPNGNGQVGVNTTNPLADFDLRAQNGTDAVASISGSTSGPMLTIDNKLAGNSTMFQISNDGNPYDTFYQGGEFVQSYAGGGGTIYHNITDLAPSSLDTLEYLNFEGGTSSQKFIDAFGGGGAATEEFNVDAVGNAFIHNSLGIGIQGASADSWEEIKDNASTQPLLHLLATANSGATLLKIEGTSGISSGSFFINALAGSTSEFSVDGTGKVTASGGFNGKCINVAFDVSGGSSCNQDVAEVYSASESMSSGDVSSIDKTSNGNPSDVKKSSIPYDPSVMGVVSTNPGLVLGVDGSSVQLGGTSSNYGQTADPRKPAIALNGKVPVKVSTINGPIEPGDALTTSSISGVAMKATQPGFILGKALGEYNNTDPNAVGTIMVFINIGWVDPSVSITDAGNLSVYPFAPSTDSLIATYGVKDNNGTDITKVGAFADAVIGNITAGSIKARDIMFEDGTSVKDRLNNLEQASSSSATKVTTLGDLLSALTTRVASLEASLNQQNTTAGTNNLALPTADTTALQTQNGTGTSTYTIERTMPNPVANPGFEQPLVNEWQGAGHADITRVTTDDNTGTASLQVRSADVNDGAENTLTTTLMPTTTYTLSWYLKSGTPIPQGTIIAGYSSDGSTANQVLCGQVTTTSGTKGWTQYSCSFTTPAANITSANAIFIGQNDVTLRTFYLDDVQVELANALAVSGNSNGGLGVSGSASATLVETSDNSTNITGTTNLPYVVRDENGNPVMQNGIFANVVSGNLQAGGINAQQLILSGRDVNARLDTLENDSSSSAVLVNKVDELSNSVNNLNDRVASLEATFSLLASGSALLNNPLASFTASSASELNLDKLTVNTDLMVLGKTTVADLGVTGRVTIGLLAIDGLDMSGGSDDAFASLNTTAGPFKIQSEGLNGVDFENGKLTIDTDGNLKTKGEITATKYNINTSDVAGASLGVGTLSAGDTSVIINTSAVSKNSTIFVTPKSKTSQPLSVTTQTAGKSFKVEVDSPADSDIKFNWWIVN